MRDEQVVVREEPHDLAAVGGDRDRTDAGAHHHLHRLGERDPVRERLSRGGHDVRDGPRRVDPCRERTLDEVALAHHSDERADRVPHQQRVTAPDGHAVRDVPDRLVARAPRHLAIADLTDRAAEADGVRIGRREEPFLAHARADPLEHARAQALGEEVVELAVPRAGLEEERPGHSVEEGVLHRAHGEEGDAGVRQDAGAAVGLAQPTARGWRRGGGRVVQELERALHHDVQVLHPRLRPGRRACCPPGGTRCSARRLMRSSSASGRKSKGVTERRNWNAGLPVTKWRRRSSIGVGCQPPSFVACDDLSSGRRLSQPAARGDNPLIRRRGRPESRHRPPPGAPLTLKLKLQLAISVAVLVTSVVLRLRRRQHPLAGRGRRRAHPRGEDRAGAAGPRRQGEHGLRAHRRAVPGGRGRALPRAEVRAAARAILDVAGATLGSTSRGRAAARCRSRGRRRTRSRRSARCASTAARDTSGSTPSAGPTRRC